MAHENRNTEPLLSQDFLEEEDDNENPEKNSRLIEPTLDKKIWGKDVSLVYIAYGDGVKNVTAPVTLNGKRTLDLLIRETFDRAQKINPASDIVTKFSIRVGDLMNTLRVTHTSEIRTVMDNLNRTPVRLDFLGDRARAKAREISQGAKAIGKTDSKRQAEMIAEARAVSMASTILSYSRFSMNDRAPLELGKDPSEEDGWSRDDILVIAWGNTVLELLKDPSNAFSLLDTAVKEMITSKHAYSLYDILIAELYRQQGMRDPRFEKITSRPISLVKCHQMLASDVRSTKAYYRTDPMFDPTKPPYSSSGLKEGGLRFFKKEILNKAIDSLNKDTDLEVEYTIDKGRRKDRNIYFHIKRKSDPNVWDAEESEALRLIKSLEGMNSTSAELLVQRHPEEIVQAAYWRYKESEAKAHAKGNLINRPAAYLEKIIANIIRENSGESMQHTLFEPEEESPAEQEPVFSSAREKQICTQFANVTMGGKITPEGVLRRYIQFSEEQKVDIPIDLALLAATSHTEFRDWLNQWLEQNG